MRDRTAVLLAILIVLVVLYGAQVIGYLLLGIVILALALVLAGVIAVWVLRRRARRVLGAWERNMGDLFEQAQRQSQAPLGKQPGDVIDVEPSDVRDAGPADGERQTR